MSDAPEYHGPAGAVGAYNRAFSARPRAADAGRQQNSGGNGVDTKRSDVFNDGASTPWQDSDHDKEAVAYDDGASMSLGEKIRQGMGVNPSKYSTEQADYEG